MTNPYKPISIEGKLDAILDDLHEVKLRLASLEQRIAAIPKHMPSLSQPQPAKDADFNYPQYHD